MKRLTDKELILALLTCSTEGAYCNDCPAFEFCGAIAAPPCNLLIEAARRIENVVVPIKCKNCHYFVPYEKPVEDFDGRCFARGCETDEEEYCSYSTNGNLKTNF